MRQTLTEPEPLIKLVRIYEDVEGIAMTFYKIAYSLLIMSLSGPAVAQTQRPGTGGTLPGGPPIAVQPAPGGMRAGMLPGSPPVATQPAPGVPPGSGAPSLGGSLPGGPPIG